MRRRLFACAFALLTAGAFAAPPAEIDHYISCGDNWFMSQSAAMGALPTLYAAVESDVAGGSFYGPKGLFEMRGYPGEVKFAPAALDDMQCLHLWKASEKLTGVTYTP